MRRLLLSAVCLMACAAPARAQVVQDEKLWFNATLFGSAGDFAYFAEVQPRFGDGISRLDQIILRPAIGWKISKDLTVYQGYAYVETPVPGARSIIENRSFQQVSWEIGAFAGGKLSSRTRFEQREQSDGRDIGLRLREQVRYALPLTEKKDGIAGVGWTEAFVALNDTDWGARAGFDQVRTFVGLELPIQGKSTVEVGYLNRTIDMPGSSIGVDHILSLNLFLRY